MPPAAFDVDEVRDARADVLAAQQVLELARTEMHRAEAEVSYQQERAALVERPRRADLSRRLGTPERAAILARYHRLLDDQQEAGSPREMGELTAQRRAYQEIAGALGLRFVATEQGWTLDEAADGEASRRRGVEEDG